MTILISIWAIIIIILCYQEVTHNKCPRQKEMENFFKFKKQYEKKYPNHPKSDYDRCGRFWVEYNEYNKH